MPVSKERLAEISQLANGQLSYGIDTSTFSESDWERCGGESEAEIERFCESNTDSEELHAFAAYWNWDFGRWPLEVILENPACEAATALLIYWGGCPEFFRKYANRQEIEADETGDLEAFDFLSDIEARYMAGEFRVGSIAFDPANPDGHPGGYSLVGMYDDMRERFVRELPPVMYAAVGGAARNDDRPGGR
jgi:hypothetical protein